MTIVENSNRPAVAVVGCFRCGHSKQRHERPGFEPQCTAEHCTCLRFQAPNPTGVSELERVPAATPPTPPTAPRVGAAPPHLSAEQLLAVGQRAESKRTRNLTEKITWLLVDLAGLVDDERATANARREIAELEEKLAAAKAKLRGERTTRAAAAPASPSPSSTSGGGSLRCPDCDKEFATATGLGSHRHHAHGYRAGAS